MSWTSEAGGGREFNLGQHALPDLHFSFQMCGAHWRKVSPGWSYPEHDHALFELNYVLEGQQVMRLHGRTQLQQPGELILIAPGCRHDSEIGSPASMTYFCLHFDIDDAVMYGRLAALGSHLHAADSELTTRLKPDLERLSRLSGETEEELAAESFAIRTCILRLLLELCQYAFDRPEAREDPAMVAIVQPEEARMLRERYALEKKMQDYLGGPDDGDRLSDRSLFPPFRWIGLFTVMVPDQAFWTKPDRFLAKILLEDELGRFGVSVVAAGERLLTAVLFTDGYSVPPLEEYAADCRRLLEQRLNEPVRIGLGGVAASSGELKGLYRQSLNRLGLSEAADWLPDFDFVNRTVRLALLVIESEYADSELTLAGLAARLELTPNYLSALFTAETGRTFTWHLTRIRIDRACALLRQSRLKVYQIARQIGYADPAYFSRSFKGVVGLSPAAYRENLLDE